MRLLFSTALIIAGSVAVASCSTSFAQPQPSARAAQELAAAVAGRTQGPPVDCLPSYRAAHQRVIDDWTILYRDGQTVYVQHPRGGCRGIGNGGYTLVARRRGTNRLCSGDIYQLVDLRTGIGGGACVFGPFVPYTRR